LAVSRFLALLSRLEQPGIAPVHWLSSLIINPSRLGGVLLVEASLPGVVQMAYQDEDLL
jgi:hypothetical protein